MLAPKAKVIEGELGRLDSWRRMLEVESSECLTMSAGCWVLGAGCWVLGAEISHFVNGQHRASSNRHRDMPPIVKWQLNRIAAPWMHHRAASRVLQYKCFPAGVRQVRAGSMRGER